MKGLISCLVLISVLCLSACQTLGKDKEDPYAGMTAGELYQKAEQALAKKKYMTAIKYYEALDNHHPFSEYSERAMLDSIYANFEEGEYATTGAIAERFIRLFPRSKRVDYAYYMKGLSNFHQERGVFAKMLPMDESWRDPGSMLQSYNDFSTLVSRFPNSQYTPDARQRMIFLRNMFAQRELNVANFYMERKLYVAVNNRAAYLVENYPQSPQVEDALILMVKANRALGLQKPAEDALKLLQLNYPESRGLKRLLS